MQTGDQGDGWARYLRLHPNASTDDSLESPVDGPVVGEAASLSASIVCAAWPRRVVLTNRIEAP